MFVFRFYPISLLVVCAGSLLIGCTRAGSITEDPAPPPPAAFTTFTIQQGRHASDQSAIKPVSTSNMQFVVRFNGSAIYQTKDTINQSDINKLWGFSEGLDNQYNSARIGWAWYNHALRLYGYVYKNGVRAWQEIAAVDIDTDIACSIAISPSHYIFQVNKQTITMDRGPATPIATGLQQFPYFGGDEPAPQLITIQLKSL